MSTQSAQPVSAWEHAALVLGSLAAIAVGAIDAQLRQRLGIGVDVGLIAGGLAALGVKASGALPG